MINFKSRILENENFISERLKNLNNMLLIDKRIQQIYQVLSNNIKGNQNNNRRFYDKIKLTYNENTDDFLNSIFNQKN